MKRTIAPLIALLLLSHCSSINLFLMKDRVPETDLLKFEQADLFSVRSSVYKTKSSTITLKVVISKDETTILKVRDSNDENRLTFNGDKTAANTLSYEYTIDKKGAVTEVFLVENSGARHKLDQTVIPSHETSVILEKNGYKITTHAGTFSCGMRVEKEKDTYYIFFLNSGILGRVVRCHILDEAGYLRFSSMDQRAQETLLTEDMIEIYETGK